MKRGPRARQDMNYKQKRQDAYKSSVKRSEPTVCTGCGSLFMEGRWTWLKPPPLSRKTVCPACRRIADNYPAGTLEIRGSFFRDRREELERLIRHEEEAEMREHALERIMAIRDEGGKTFVTTTGIHLARRIGESLARAYQGEVSFRYGDSERSIRILWSRE